MSKLNSRCLGIITLLSLSGTLHAQLQVTLEAKQAENFGLHSVILQSSQAVVAQSSEARVLDPSVLYNQISDLETSINSLTISSAQQASLSRLFQNQQNASRAAVAQATLLMRTDQSNLARAQTAIRTTWGNTVASWSAAERAQRVLQLRSGSASFLRVELNSPADVSSVFSTPNSSLEWLGMLPSADPQTGRTGALLWLKPGAPALSRLEIQVRNPHIVNPADARLLIPRSAVLRINGGYFVFVETATLAFEMRELSSPTRSPDGWLVQRGFNAGESVVNVGAASLLTLARGTGAQE